MKFGLVAFLKRSLEFFVCQGRTHPFLEEFVDLLRCTSVERVGIQERVKLVLDRIEIGVISHPLDEIVIQSEMLHLVCSFMGKNLDNFWKPSEDGKSAS